MPKWPDAHFYSLLYIKNNNIYKSFQKKVAKWPQLIFYKIREKNSDCYEGKRDFIKKNFDSLIFSFIMEGDTIGKERRKSGN